MVTILWFVALSLRERRASAVACAATLFVALSLRESGHAAAVWF
jgi:hypothetical protein